MAVLCKDTPYAARDTHPFHTRNVQSWSRSPRISVEEPSLSCDRRILTYKPPMQRTPDKQPHVRYNPTAVLQTER
jgi:hypothetical protein